MLKKTNEWYGFEARKIDIDTKAEIYLIPLFWPWAGHCGVAVKAKRPVDILHCRCLLFESRTR